MNGFGGKFKLTTFEKYLITIVKFAKGKLNQISIFRIDGVLNILKTYIIVRSKQKNKNL